MKRALINFESYTASNRTSNSHRKLNIPIKYGQQIAEPHQKLRVQHEIVSIIQNDFVFLTIMRK